MPPKNRKVVVDEDSSEDMDESMEPSTSKPRRKPSPKKTKAPAPPADVEMEDVEDDLDDQHRLMEDYDDENLLNMAIPPQPEPCMSADGTGSRLMIRQIVANNFKSYYGPQRIGPFHKNFSAIIGPNGSGKSNVIDSLLFVFGFRAKKIRLKKIGELIHNSNGKDNLDFCSVEITFQKIIDKEDGDFDIVEGSVFSVARTAYKDNTSKYTINGKTKSIKDVVKKLREVGIDLIHNRFLILQGEVEHIALMKPKSETGKEEGMLEYLEDIIGSSRFKEPIDRLTKKLDSLSADRSQQTQKVKLADKERQAMEGPVREMIMFLRCENQVSLIKNKLFHIKLCKLQRQIQEKEPELVTMQEEKSNIEAEVKKLSDDRKETEKEVTEIETKRDTVQKELDVCYRSIAEMDAKEARRKLDLKKCAKDLANMRTNIEKEEANLQRINTVPAKSTAKIKLLEGTILELEEIIKENEAHVDNNRPRFEKKSVVLQADRQKAEEALGEKQRIVDEVNSKLTIAREELQLIVGENEKLSARLKEMHKQLDEHKSEFENKERELSELKLSIPETEKELANEREEVKNNKAKVDKLNFDLQGFRSKLGEDKAALSSHDQGNHTTRELTAAKERGEFTGFVGRLGDLGAIDPKYDAAISTTVSALHSYIVEKKADALVGVDICVKKKIGRTNFMIISEVPDCEDMINKPPQNFPAPRLFDLIKIPDPRLRKMFYSSIKDTLIVSDLSEAKKIANNCIGPTNYRYITLDGAVMDMNGTISGGGKPRRGAIGSQVNCTAELRKAQERIGSYQKSIDEATAEIQTYSEAIRKSDQKIFHMTASLNKMKERMRILNNEVPMLEGKVNNLEKQISFHEAQVGKLQIDEAVTKKKKDVVDQLEQEHEAAQEEFRTCKDKFDRAKDKFDALWKDLCGRFRDTADESKKKLEDTKTEIAKEQSKLKSFERDKNKAEERLSELKADLETKVKHETALIKTEGANESDLSAKHKLKKSLMTQIKELEDQLKKVRDSNSEMNEKEGNLQKSLLDMNEKLENLDLQIKALKTDSVGVKKQISALKLHNIKAIGLMPEKKNKKDDRADFLNDSLDLEEEQVAKQKEKKKQQKKAARRGGDDEAMDVDSEEKSGSDGDEDVDALPTFTEEELADVDRDDLKFKLGTLEQKISANKKDINMNILDDYANKVKKFEREKEYLDQIKKKYNDHLGFQDNLKKQRMAEFMEGFERIGLALKEMYQMITLGGDAALDLKDSIDPFSEGIQFMVRPPKKSWKNIENLSGGEKTLSSLALVFALHHYRPTPLYVMDEIDAALDFRNVSIIGHYIKDRTKNAQFIIISLRNNMFELGDRLIGIYKTFDCTKNVVVDPEKVIATANRLRAGVDAAYKGGILEGHQPMAIENSEASTSSVSTQQDKSQVADNSKSRKRQSTDAAVGGKKLDDRASPAHNKERRSRRKPKEKAEVEVSDDDDLESDLEDDEDEL